MSHMLHMIRYSSRPAMTLFVSPGSVGHSLAAPYIDKLQHARLRAPTESHDTIDLGRIRMDSAPYTHLHNYGYFLKPRGLTSVTFCGCSVTTLASSIRFNVFVVIFANHLHVHASQSGSLVRQLCLPSWRSGAASDITSSACKPFNWQNLQICLCPG